MAHDDCRELAEVVACAVADAKGVSPLELRPLAEVIDPDALERLVASMGGVTDGSAGTVEFTYSGYRVAVAGDGDVEVDEA